MKRVLILTCSTGEGHNSAARAIEAAFRRKGVACEILDPVSFQGERAKRLVSGLYNRTIQKAPRVFGTVYKLGDLYSKAHLPSPVYHANAHYSEALKHYILEQDFDAVICTHLYGMEAMTAIRAKEDFPIPCFGVMTDYVCIPFLDETRLTGFFVPTAETGAHLIRQGIDPSAIRITGIPVDRAFTHHPERTQARRQLGVDGESRVFLVMTGGVGCENMEQLSKKLLEAMEPRDLMLVLTGKNQELKERLDDLQDPRCRTVAFTREVPTYMAASDVLLSKPGGLSSTEAAVCNIPMVHIHAIPGCESYNARYYAANGLALSAKDDAEAVSCALYLADHPQERDKMRACQRSVIPADAAEQIFKEVEAQCVKQIRSCG